MLISELRKILFSGDGLDQPARRCSGPPPASADWYYAFPGSDVLAIIGRWQDRRRPLACYTAACGGLQLPDFCIHGHVVHHTADRLGGACYPRPVGRRVGACYPQPPV